MNDCSGVIHERELRTDTPVGPRSAERCFAVVGYRGEILGLVDPDAEHCAAG